jgi:hypothetical protein
MKFVATVVSFALLVLLGAAAVLGLSWLISLAIRAVWGVGLYPSLVMALGVLGILVLFVNAVAMKSISGLSELIRETLGAGRAADETEEEEGEEEEAAWFSPCPCGRGRPFAQCCGRRAFRKRQGAGP